MLVTYVWVVVLAYGELWMAYELRVRHRRIETHQLRSGAQSVNHCVRKQLILALEPGWRVKHLVPLCLF
jgi:hypothetical protein